MTKGKTNRKKGHTAELYYKNFFVELGFEHCVTSRFGSRQHDNAKIDLMHLPFNLQIKAGKQTGMNPCKELGLMEQKIKEFFPASDPIHQKPEFLIHKKQEGAGKRYSTELVYMSFKDFETFKSKGSRLSEAVIRTRKSRSKNEDYGDYNTVISINFAVFIEEIVKKHFLC